MNLCSRVLRLSVLPLSNEGPQVAMCDVECCGSLKCQALVLDASLPSFSTSWRCSRNGRLVVFMSRQCTASCKGTGNAINDISGGRGETISDLNGSFRSRYPVSVENQRTSFATCASALKSTGLVISFKCASDEEVTHVFVALYEVSAGC